MLRTSMICLLAGWLGAGQATAAPDDPKQLATQARAVLRTHCFNCHHGDGSEGGNIDFLNHAELLAKHGEDAALVVPGKSAESYLFERVVKNQMPPRTVPDRPSEADKAILKKWIDAGALAFTTEQAKARKFIALQEILTAVRDHLRNAPREKRTYLRYFTLTHLYNNPAVPEADLKLYRAALSKAINSLSWKARIVVPEILDKTSETVLVIDVRDLDWDKQDLWHEIMVAYPYGLKYRNHPNLQQLDEDICDSTGCDMPLVRADWFIATATRPPLYHTLLQIPEDAKKLEMKLNVDIPANFRADKLARAGFIKSGVSKQNRLVERHESIYGAYWKSYDFKPEAGRAKLTRFPLGPLNLFPDGKHPYPKQAFVHDGGEIVFNLPNGLQGYMLINGKDQRIDEGPIQVVSDSKSTAGTPSIVNGLSCMACHVAGVRPLPKDILRDHSAVFGDAEKKIKMLYPEEKTMLALLDEDEQRFVTALEKAIGPFLRDQKAKKLSIKGIEEPIGKSAELYRLAHLDLKTVACELDIEDPKQVITKVGEKKLKQLGLESLLNEGGIVNRLEWEAIDGSSLMQEVARELRATPFQVLKSKQP